MIKVKDFAKVLAAASNTELTEETMSAYLKRRTKTRAVKLDQLIPVELRYETIVLEDGRLHIYRDVYDQNTNTQERLRAVFAANGASFENLGDEEKAQVLEALDAMSRHPKKRPTQTIRPANKLQNSANIAVNAIDKKAEAERQKKLRNQREIMIEIGGLAGKGYPAPVNLDSGAGAQLSAVAPRRTHPKVRSVPGAVATGFRIPAISPVSSIVTRSLPLPVLTSLLGSRAAVNRRPHLTDKDIQFRNHCSALP